ncbi:hybrid sensor histidine kinase/response regulator transcription factor [Microterricola viridarii]|uniref:Signal transduction histidine kinase n=1 Tax=Microterricola viridarii TaxID=412690 RepID=A0A1H1QMH6_9MICO|nr:ATP-binding protein [Microterricola viridarii]SDS24576.1 Signal transduction histidine kinase [Microterricola viridarii]
MENSPASASPSASSATEAAQYQALSALAADLVGQFELRPLLERILRHTMALLGCDSGSICTVDEVAGTYRKEVDVGVGCLSGQTFPLDEGVTGEIVRARGSVLFDEYAEVAGGHIAQRERASLHGVIGVPIRWDGRIIGSAVVFSREAGRRFTDADAHLVELFATHAAIAITNARLHALTADRERASAVLDERERVVRDMHDTIGRGLVSVLLHLDAAEKSSTEAEPRRSLGAARAAARAALDETRRTADGLGPALLEGRSLSDAIALELAWVESTVRVETHLVVIGDPEPLPAETARQLFRIVQESLTNVVEHASARHVRVGLVYGSENVSVLVEDDGQGFDVDALAEARPSAAKGLGLQSLVARAGRLGGTVQIESTPHWGTRVRAELPSSAASAVDARSRWRVLVVHQNAIVRAGLVRVLGQVEPGIEVVGEIADASAAIEAYELLRPHVVLANLDLPHIDGAQLTSYLRAIDPQSSVVLIVHDLADERMRGAARIGATGFVAQDADPVYVTRAVVAAARGESLLSSAFLSRLAATLDPPGTAPLTAREREVRALVERGVPDKQIAARLRISVKTVEKHVGAILRKTGAPNRTALAAQSALHSL